MIYLSHRFTSSSNPEAQKSFDSLSQTIPRLRFNLFVISETFATELRIAFIMRNGWGTDKMGENLIQYHFIIIIILLLLLLLLLLLIWLHNP
jgi:hypothetical protein